MLRGLPPLTGGCGLWWDCMFLSTAGRARGDVPQENEVPTECHMIHWYLVERLSQEVLLRQLFRSSFEAGSPLLREQMGRR
jgi:hypothetical protein